MYSEVEKAMARQKVSIEVSASDGLNVVRLIYSYTFAIVGFNFCLQVLSYHATASNKEVDRILVRIRSCVNLYAPVIFVPDISVRGKSFSTTITRASEGEIMKKLLSRPTSGHYSHSLISLNDVDRKRIELCIR